MSPHYKLPNGSLYPFTKPVDKPIALLVRVKTGTTGETTTLVQQKESGESLEELIAYTMSALEEGGLAVVHFQVVNPINPKEFMNAVD